MERNANFFRLIFIALAVLAATTYEVSVSPQDFFYKALVSGAVKGVILSFLLFSFERQVKRISLRTLNTTLIGIVIGTALGWSIVNAARTIFSFFLIDLQNQFFDFFALTAYLGSVYFALVACQTAANAWWLSIPFVKLSATAENQKRKGFIADSSAIEDPRLVELARTGLLDGELIIPSFLVKNIQNGLEASDEIIKMRWRKCSDNIKRLEAMTTLGLVLREIPLTDSDDEQKALLKQARGTSTYIITSDVAAYKITDEEAVTLISLEGLALALKPAAQRGEVLQIKIQRPGKEPKQGVGYLDDGTMVVVNGGGDFLGQTVKTQVLSQKYSSSGKIIFCNALQTDEGGQTTTPYSVGERPEMATVAPTIRIRRDAQHDTWNRN